MSRVPRDDVARRAGDVLPWALGAPSDVQMAPGGSRHGRANADRTDAEACARDHAVSEPCTDPPKGYFLDQAWPDLAGLIEGWRVDSKPTWQRWRELGALETEEWDGYGTRA